MLGRILRQMFWGRRYSLRENSLWYDDAFFHFQDGIYFCQKKLFNSCSTNLETSIRISLVFRQPLFSSVLDLRDSDVFRISFFWTNSEKGIVWVEDIFLNIVLLPFTITQIFNGYKGVSIWFLPSFLQPYLALFPTRYFCRKEKCLLQEKVFYCPCGPTEPRKQGYSGSVQYQ